MAAETTESSRTTGTTGSSGSGGAVGTLLAPVRASWASGRAAGPLRALALLVIVYLVFAVQSDAFTSSFNTRSLLTFAVPALLVTVGQTFVITLGEVDLSVAPVAALSGIVFILAQPQGLVVAFAAALGVGLAVGLFNGVVTTLLGVPSVVTTLAMLFISQGLALLLSTEPINGSRLDLTTAFGQAWGAILTPRIVLGLVVVVLAALALGRAGWGRQLYARGANVAGVQQLGLADRRLVVQCFVISGVLSAAAGTITAIGLNSASPVVGGDLLLLSIAACLIGGSRLEGGTGSVVGSALALLALLALQNGMDQIGVSAYVQQVIRGGVVLAALVAAAPRSIGGIRLRRADPDPGSASDADREGSRQSAGGTT